MSEVENTSDVAALTVQLLSAYLTNNTVASDDLAGLIRATREALTGETRVVTSEPEPETFTPAVSVRKSLASPDHIISLIDGKAYKTLKRHLAGHGLTPEDYRSRYNLPASYPMVAQSYAEHRRKIAQKSGLGARRLESENAALVPTEVTVADSSNGETAAKTQAPPDTRPHRGELDRPGKRRATPTRKIVESDQMTPGEAGEALAPDQDVAVPEGTVSDTTNAESPPKVAAAKRTRGKANSTAKKPATKRLAGAGKRADTTKAVETAERVTSVGDGLKPAGEPPAPQAVKPRVQKREGRAKLGLFSKAQTELEQPSAEASGRPASSPSPNEQPARSDGAEDDARAPAKRKRVKRMARSPKVPGADQVEAGDSNGGRAV